MAIASFGSKVFQVNSSKLYTFDEFQYSSSLQTEKQDTLGSKPSTINKGPDLDTMSFKIQLDIMTGVKPRKEWESWKSILNKGIAYPFILGGKQLGGSKWLLVGLSKSNVNIDSVGNILGMEISLSFEEYVRAGKEEKDSKGYAVSD